jgi:hypothetical protein
MRLIEMAFVRYVIKTGIAAYNVLIKSFSQTGITKNKNGGILVRKYDEN